MNDELPVIGITPVFDDETARVTMPKGYMEAVEATGGLPLMLPLTESTNVLSRAFALCHGFIFAGGHDISPEIYGEVPIPECGPACAKRDKMESALLRMIDEYDRPVLGICRGIQLMNGLFGGTLYQDLDAQGLSSIRHQCDKDHEKPVHAVQIAKGTPLYKIIGETSIRVNSYHHQSVKGLASRFKSAAWSADGLVEAVYMPEKRFFVGVQWHPELTYKHDANSIKLFKALIEACKD